MFKDSVPISQFEHSLSITKSKTLMLFRVAIAVFLSRI
jgi:hypothetical protein